MYAVAQFYSDGSCFPVELNVASESEAHRRRHWMKQGPSAAEDWRVVPMSDLRSLLAAGKVHLECFTPEAQAERRELISKS